MKIIYGSELFWPHIGGSEILSAQLLPALMKYRHDFMIITSHSGIQCSDITDFKGIPVHRFQFHLPLINRDLKGVLKTRKRLLHTIQTYKPDLIHLNGVGSDTFYHLMIISAVRLPLFITLHGMPMVRLRQENNLFHRAIHSARWVSAVSQSVLNETQDLIPEIVTHSSVIYNGLEMPDLQPTSLPFEKPILLCLGRLVRHKGFDLAINAFSEIQKQFPESQMIIAGEGPEKPALVKQVQSMHLNKTIRFTGQVEPDNVSELINSTTIIIMPSRREPFGLVAVQAGQMARPVIATRIDGLPEVIDHEQTGLLVEKQSVQAIVAAIKKLLTNPELTRTLGNNARKKAKNQFDLNFCASQYHERYIQLGQN